ncbi:MAG: lysophospholipid acyltransferase family protein [Dehalococcoidales bacterium]|nr:lysophospholipid acyltransferase family protein [Dehalococcoidales bacterium]
MGRLFYLASRELVRLFYLIFTRWDVKGRDSVPRTGPLLVVANHITFAEPSVIRLLLPRESRFATKEGFFKNKALAAIMYAYGAFPVHQGTVDRAGIHRMESYLAQGLAVCIFPEGTRSRNAELLPAFNGTAMIAHRTGAPILPIGIWGTEQLKKPFWFFKRPVIHVRFGETFTLPKEHGKAQRETATQLIMSKIAELLPPEFRGTYGNED